MGDLLESVGLKKDEGLSKLSDPEYIKHYEEEMIENKRKGTTINNRERERDGKRKVKEERWEEKGKRKREDKGKTKSKRRGKKRKIRLFILFLI